MICRRPSGKVVYRHANPERIRYKPGQGRAALRRSSRGWKCRVTVSAPANGAAVVSCNIIQVSYNRAFRVLPPPLTGKLPVTKGGLMHVPSRGSPRHMKGNQIALTLYLPPGKYWTLKAVSKRTGQSMQQLLRTALDQVLIEADRATRRYR